MTWGLFIASFVMVFAPSAHCENWPVWRGPRGASSLSNPQLNIDSLLIACLRESDDFPVSYYRFYFFSREELRIHVHVISPDGETKFWIEPKIELAVNKGLSATELNELKQLVEERQNEIREHWRKHFAG